MVVTFLLTAALVCVSVPSSTPANAVVLPSPAGHAPVSLQQSPALRVQKTKVIRIYLVALGDAGRSGTRIGCGDSLVAVTRTAPSTTTPLTTVLRLLLRMHRRYEGRPGLYNALYQSRLVVEGVTVTHGRAVISLVGALRLGGVCDDPRVKAQLRHAALQFPGVHRVAIFINHMPLRILLSGR